MGFRNIDVEWIMTKKRWCIIISENEFYDKYNSEWSWVRYTNNKLVIYISIHLIQYDNI